METLEDSPETNTQPHRRRRTTLAVTLLLLLLVLALVLTPPMVNVNRYSKRIAASMSASLGRPVHLSSVTLHLLPMPGLTLENLVVSEDPAFGSEPTIRANKVVATLRVSSLWRRQIEFSKIQFEVDDNGSAPSLNLVRNAQGHWNLESLLMHASRIDAAPTSQRTAGPTPRFPYIEATGARVNVKLGAEKMPFSLTDTDFALWLPTPRQFSVRLEAKPARTDNNVGDPGVVRLDGSLQRAANLADVPVDLQASWRDVPLGEASLLLAGVDAGWRGTLHLDVSLTGTLGKGQLHTHLTLNDLRRADFVPDRSLDLSVLCDGELEVPAAVVHNPSCNLEVPHVSAVADTVDLTSLQVNGLHVGTPGVPEAWAMDGLRLFSQRLPESEQGTGMISGTLALTPMPNATGLSFPGGIWIGQITGAMGDSLPGMPEVADTAPARPEFTIVSGPAGAVLQPLNLTAGSKAAPLTLSGSATRTGYSLTLTGTATAQEIAALAADAPPLADGLNEVLSPEKAADGDKTPAKALSVDVTCTRSWGAPQTCVQAVAAPVKTKARARRRR
jgi:hypothetical protein